MPEGIAGVDNPDGPDDEITIDPLAVPHIPIPWAVAVIAGRIPREWPVRIERRLTWRGWLLAATGAVVVIGALKLAGVIWTNPPPEWVTTLGTGVTVTGPEQVAPGHGSPGAALTGVLAALSSKDRTTFCDYMFVVSAARCTGPSGQGSRDRLPYGVSVKIGYVAVSGTRALVGFTGKICSPGTTPECTANTNPAAVFSAGNTFAALWEQTLHSNSNISSYRLLPCAEVGGKWYVGPGPALAFPSGPSPKLAPLLAEGERDALEAPVRRRTASQSLALRARVVLACRGRGRRAADGGRGQAGRVAGDGPPWPRSGRACPHVTAEARAPSTPRSGDRPGRRT